MNRWVGIVSLRETAPPTPVHRIALAIDAATQLAEPCSKRAPRSTRSTDPSPRSVS
ncbi:MULTISPECIES: hypothetical protein [unclassified Streptomyces]|uniref:hypothetical protein n=1 Tax=unclassified Streptomyces TaxID=2593676 RepID=UPI000A77945A|nr:MULTISPECIES: hypothetical protein [unclassified Streptomyces]